MSVSEPSVFLVKFLGTIETGELIDGDNLYIRYSYHYGPDWEIVAGIEDGISQSVHRSLDERAIFVWNFPLDITFKSTNPFGWPQLILDVYGPDFFGNDVIRGYSSCHLPIIPGYHKEIFHTFVPESASQLQKIVSWFTGRRPEFVDSSLPAQGTNREVTRVRSQGHITVSMDVIFKDYHTLGYDCGYRNTDILNLNNFTLADDNNDKQEASTSGLQKLN